MVADETIFLIYSLLYKLAVSVATMPTKITTQLASICLRKIQ